MSSPPPPPPLNILILGASIAGPALASFLLLSPLPAAQKPHITICERAPALRSEGQNIDVRGSGLTLLRKLGIAEIVRANTTGEEGVVWVDGKDRVVARVAAGEGGPTADVEISRGRLGGILAGRCEMLSEGVEREGGRGVEWVSGDYVEGFEQAGDGVRVRFARSGDERMFDLVVGADGLQSRTRRMLFGEEGDRAVRELGIYSAYFSFPPGPTDTAWRRWFHAPGRRGIMLRPDTQRGRTTCILHVSNDADPRLREMAVRGSASGGGQKALMDEYFAQAGWESERVLREMRATDDFYYDMMAQVKLERWSKGRVVLLGDAAYCASPLSGMGTTLALTGAYNLAGSILRNPDDVSAAFTSYEDLTRPLVASAQGISPVVLAIFKPDTAWQIWLLNFLAGWIAWPAPLFKLVFQYIGPGTRKAGESVEDFGMRECEEMGVDEV